MMSSRFGIGSFMVRNRWFAIPKIGIESKPCRMNTASNHERRFRFQTVHTCSCLKTQVRAHGAQEHLFFDILIDRLIYLNIEILPQTWGCSVLRFSCDLAGYSSPCSEEVHPGALVGLLHSGSFHGSRESRT